MTTVTKVFRQQTRDLLRGRALYGYAVFFGLAALGLLVLGGGTARALPSLATLTVLVVPLVSLLVTTTFVYHSGDFIELLLSHPVGRRPLFAGMYVALIAGLGVAFAVGLLLPLAGAGALVTHGADVATLALTGLLLTGVFSSLGLLIALRIADPAQGNGVALVVWLTLAVLYDGAVLFAAYHWAAYPLEVPMLALMALNPVDVARVLVIMSLDAAALMGYTGAVFQDVFGGFGGYVLAVASLVAWTALPGMLAFRAFERKDF